MRNRGGHGHVDYVSNKPQSLAEQLKELAKSPEQKKKEQPWHEWSKDLVDYVNNTSCPLKLLQYVSSKYKTDFENFHQRGSSFREVTAFINSKSEELRG